MIIETQKKSYTIDELAETVAELAFEKLMKRLPERRVIEIDVSQMENSEAEQHIRDAMNSKVKDDE